MRRIAIVIPVYNEREHLAEVVDSIRKQLAELGMQGRIVLAENGSTDGTAELVRELAADGSVHAIHLPEPDYGRALRAGLLEAADSIVVNFSVDWVDMLFLRRAVELLDEADIVLASKRHAASTDGRTLLRRKAGEYFHRIVSRIFDLHVSDTHGIKALRLPTTAGVIEACTLGRELFETELVIRAVRSGLKVVEVPVAVRETRPSRLRLGGRVFRAMRQLVALWTTLRREGKQVARGR